MASTQRQTSAGITSTRTSEWDEFFQLVREIERTAKYHRDVDQPVSTLGEDGLPSHELLRFKSNNHLAFPGGAVEALRHYLTDDSEPLGERHEVIVNFMGLTGPSGVLPQHYTRLVMERLKQRDTALADFFDLFNHRLISLFYRSWVKYRFPVQYENHAQKQQQDPFTRALKSVSGLYANQEHNAQLYYSGHFSRANKSSTNLGHLLQDFLDMPVTIRSFIGQWLPIKDRDRAVLGSGPLGRNHKLGYGVLLGKRCWDIQTKVNIEIGPVNYETYQTLLPSGRRFNELKSLINNYVPVHLAVDLIFLVTDSVNNSQPLSGGLRLSQNTWLQGENAHHMSGKIHLNRND